MRFIEAKPEEAHRITALASKIFGEVYYFEDERGVSRYLKYELSPDAIAEYMSKGVRYILVTTDDGGTDAGFYAYKCNGRTMVIDKLYLAKEFRSNGLGTEIVRGIEKTADG